MNLRLRHNGHSGVQAQIARATNEMLEYGSRLGSDARAIGRNALDQVRGARGRRKTVLPSNRTLLGLGIVSQLFKRRPEDRVRVMRLTRKDVTDDFVEALASSLEKRLVRSEQLKRALVEPLRDEVPRLRRLPDEGSSRWGWLLTTGMIIGAGYGIDYLVRQSTGKGLMQYISDQYGGTQGQKGSRWTSMAGRTDTTRYRDVHNTAGAEMPDLGRETGAGDVISGSGTFTGEPGDPGSPRDMSY